MLKQSWVEAQRHTPLITGQFANLDAIQVMQSLVQLMISFSLQEPCTPEPSSPFPLLFYNKQPTPRHNMWISFCSQHPLNSGEGVLRARAFTQTELSKKVRCSFNRPRLHFVLHLCAPRPNPGLGLRPYSPALIHTSCSKGHNARLSLQSSFMSWMLVADGP